jgi:hypothetical protein
MILGIFIGACGAFMLVGVLLTVMGIANVSRNIHMHDELMDWHERSLKRLTERNELTESMIEELRTISNAIASR